MTSQLSELEVACSKRLDTAATGTGIGAGNGNGNGRGGHCRGGDKQTSACRVHKSARRRRNCCARHARRIPPRRTASRTTARVYDAHDLHDLYDARTTNLSAPSSLRAPRMRPPATTHGARKRSSPDGCARACRQLSVLPANE